jgi:hypothetical protein
MCRKREIVCAHRGRDRHQHFDLIVLGDNFSARGSDLDLQLVSHSQAVVWIGLESTGAFNNT